MSMPEAMVPLLRAGFDPLPELARLREDAPVHRVTLPGTDLPVVLVLRHPEVRKVLGDSGTFSNDLRRAIDHPIVEASAGNDGGLAFRDPPEHTRLRRLLVAEFTGRRLRRLEPRVRQIVDERLDQIERSGPPADLVQAFAAPIPSLVISELLGVPADERERFLSHSHDRFDFSAGPATSLTAGTASVDHLIHLVARQRREPGGGLLGALVREHGDELGDREIAGLADGLLTGGHDTTTSMLALGALWLLHHPAHAELIRTTDNHIEPLVEEMLRYLSVVQISFPRIARHDTTIAGHHVAAGEMVVCSLAAANRDPALRADPDEVDPSSIATTHVAFGHGSHHCIGAPLARMELRIAYPALLRRFPTLRLPVPAEEVSFRALSLVHGLTELPVTW